MLKQYKKEKAVPFILRRIYEEDYATFSQDMLKTLISRCIDADFDYMFSSDILYPDGSHGEYFYNKENARRHILLMLIGRQELTDELFDDYYKLVDDYLDFNLSYLEHNGLRYPTDEMI